MKKRIDQEFLAKLGLGKIVNFDSYVQGFAIDSRKIQSPMAFVALPGENTDGHQYLQAAYERGARLLVVSQDWWQDNQDSRLPLLITADPKQALQKIARAYRKQFNHPVLCITGSNGKTTTVKMVTAILSQRYNVHTTIGNYNNELGVPLSILAHQKEHNFSVLELGTNHFGEIEFLAGIAQPTAGLITNIGLGHVEFLKDKAGVAKAKSELFKSLSQTGNAFVNSDDQYIRDMSKPSHQISYGFDNLADYKGRVVHIDDKARYKIEINNQYNIKLPVTGESFAKNALAAFTVGHYYSVDSQAIITALENFSAVDSRLKIFKGNYTILDDTYNANPDSTKSALNTLANMDSSGKKIFVFGDMLELGPKSEKYHAEIGRYACQQGIDLLFSYGNWASRTTQTAQKQGLEAQHFTTKSELSKALKTILQANDIVLVKGSRGNRMEDIVKEVI